MAKLPPVLIKNCGLKDDISIREAVRTGASFLGFIHHEPSPRHLELDRIELLLKQVPSKVKSVIVLQDPSDELLEELPESDFVQIHGVTDPERIRAIGELLQSPIITAIRVRSADDLKVAPALEKVSAHLLFDAYHETEAGGSGERFDWSLLKYVSPTKPWFLAGGLTAQNVADAIGRTNAPMVDVSSGIEWARGIKSPEKIAAFNAAVLNAHHA